MYKSGLGTSKNKKLSYVYINLALYDNYKPQLTKCLIRQLERTLSTEQVSEAKKMTLEWMRVHQVDDG